MRSTEAEKKLWREVIFQAITDATLLTRTANQRKLKEDALSFLFNKDNEDDLFDVCFLIQLDITQVRRFTSLCLESKIHFNHKKIEKFLKDKDNPLLKAYNDFLKV